MKWIIGVQKFNSRLPSEIIRWVANVSRSRGYKANLSIIAQHQEILNRIYYYLEIVPWEDEKRDRWLVQFSAP